MFKNKYARAAALVAAGTFVTISEAMAAIDVTSAITVFSDIETAVPLVGAAFLGALGLMAAWKLARGLFA